MSEKFVINSEDMTDFSEKMGKILKNKYNYDNGLINNIIDVAENLISFFGVEYSSIICEAIISCEYRISSGVEGIEPKYISEMNEGEIKRQIILPINSDIDSPYAKESVLVPTIKLITSYKNEFSLDVKRRGLMTENLVTKEINGKSLQEEIEDYIYRKILGEIISEEVDKKIKPKSKIVPLNAAILFDSSYLDLGEDLRGGLLTGSLDNFIKGFNYYYGENYYEKFINESQDKSYEEILSDYKNMIDIIEKEKSKQFA